MKKQLWNASILFVYLCLSILYLEFVFKIRVLNLTWNFDIFRITMFSLTYAVYVMFVLMFFKQKTVKIMMYVIVSIITFLYFNQEIYSSFVEGFYSVQIVGDFTLGLSFFSDYFTAFQFEHVAYLVPLILLVGFSKLNIIVFDTEYRVLKQPLIVLIIGTLLLFSSLRTISEDIEDNPEAIQYSEMDLYTYMYDSQSALKKFGLLTYTQRDFFSLFRHEPLTRDEYEILLNDYFSHKDYHYVNAYSNLLEDKNLVLIMAESLDTFAINEELTPTLYNLKQNYTYFENYYSPLYYRSTADTEFMTQTGLYPNKNVTLSMSAYIDNYFPNTLPRLFKEDGYDTYSFHNYTDYFYPRTKFHTTTLGYDQYYGSEALGLLDNPLENEIIFNHEWQSDLELMELSIPSFINSNKFFANFVTVSGHFRYNDQHDIANKHVDKVRQYEIDNDIILDEEIFYYLAANIELDYAVKYLMDELEEANKLDDTVIMIYGDHYAYGINEDTIWNYDETIDTGDEMNLHKVPMMIYSDSYLLNGVKTNYMSSIDIMPTIANLFDLNLEYEAIFGNDALARLDNIVRFADMSFISKDFRYDSLSERYRITNDVITPEDLTTIHNNIIADYLYNINVLQYDYYKENEDLIE